MGRKVKALRPVLSAERVAEAVVGLAERPRRELVVGLSGRQMKLTRTLAPPVYERLMRKQVDRDQFEDVPAPPSDGNLFEPVPEGTAVSGGWQEQRGARGGPIALAALALAAPAAFVALRRRG